MRVIAGSARGLKLKTIEGDSTRPTKDMVKEALFSMLAPYLSEAMVLDLFAGSGAIGIESLSRGASLAYFCDKNPDCVDIIKENVLKSKFENQAKIFNLDYQKMIEKVRNVSFDIIYIDPPYNKGLGVDAIETISSYDVLKKYGILVFETDTDENSPDIIGKYEKFKTKKYGRNILSFYKVKGE